MAVLFALLVLAVIKATFSAESGPTTIQVDFPPRTLIYKEEWNYFPLPRGNANLFWWLYYEVDDTNSPKNDRPWMIWLQGGPGASGTGFGNFQEIGPKDVKGETRPNTWLSRGEILFVDSPVGSGYSYVTNRSALTTDVDQIAKDLVDFTINFVGNHPNYKTRPYYITCESYGGKVAAVYAWQLYQAIQDKKIELNLKGVSLGDSWVSPIDFVDTWPDYLYYASRLSLEGRDEAKKTTDLCDSLVAKNLWPSATTCWNNAENVITRLSGGVSFYNILKQGGQDAWSMVDDDPRQTSMLRFEAEDDELDRLMNGQVKTDLKIIPPTVTWGGQSGQVFTAQRGDFMKPVVDTVDAILNSTDLGVYIYNGQWDLICDTAGVERWVNRLKWALLPKYKGSPRQPVYDMYGSKPLVGFLQKFQTLNFYWILNAGHMVPADAPTASLTMLDQILKG